MHAHARINAQLTAFLSTTMGDSYLLDPPAEESKRKKQEDMLSPAMSPRWSRHSEHKHHHDKEEAKPKGFLAKLQDKFRKKT